MVMVMGFSWVILGGVFTRQNTPEGCTDTDKGSFLPYKQVSGRNGDYEWLRMTSAFILCILLWKVQKSHAANKGGSINLPDWNDFKCSFNS